MPRSPNNPQPIVFVVDDDQAVCSSLKFALELEGFAVSTFADGESLLSRADLPRPHCLVVDYKLLGMSGIDLLNELRRRDVQTPALLITSNPSRTLRSAAERLGVSIIEKPLLTNALSECVREICRSPEGRR